LDSGATSIEIKLKDMGIESIEVSDNGSGIDPDNYETLALKHHTSKLAEFADLENGHVTSFGFRGEALNAVCELSREFSVTTKQEGEKVGFVLSFHRNGRYIYGSMDLFINILFVFFSLTV
jgi:DNA mismatch repair protein PMS2